MRCLVLVLVALTLTACANAPAPGEPHPYQDYLDQKDLGVPEPDDFQHCRGYGCAIRDRVSLDKGDWKKIKALFRGVKSGEKERAAISKSIALFEQKMGQETNTSGDVAGTFGEVGKYQLDCIDESTNTTIFLSLLEKQSILKYNAVSSPMARSPFTGMANGKFWPHQTAVVVDKETGESFAVDSWFRDNGAPADIVALNEWIYGWAPKEISQ